MSSVTKFEPGSGKDRVLKALAGGALASSQIGQRAAIGGDWLDITLRALMRDGYIRQTSSGRFELASPPEPEKHCAACNETKSVTEFGKADTPDGRSEYCKSCMNSPKARAIRNGEAAPPSPAAASEAKVEKPPEKFCSKCEVTKSIEEFGRNKTKPDGRQNWCKPCMNAATISAQQRKKEKRDSKRKQVAEPPRDAGNEGFARSGEFAPARCAADPGVYVSEEQPPPRIFNIPHELGVYVRVDLERVFISQPLFDHVDRSVRLTRERALELGRWLVATLEGTL